MNKGDVVIANLPKFKGSVQTGTRVCIIVQNDVGNEYSPLTILVPCTKKEKPKLPTHFYYFSHKGIKNTVLCEQILTLPKDVVVNTIGRLHEKQLKQLNECLKISLQLGGAT